MIKFIFWLCLFLVVYTYALYPIILFLIDRFLKREEGPPAEFLPSVSLIIAAYNEEKVMVERIENCLALDYPAERLEIIIASDGSDDRTAEIVRSCSDRRIKLFDYRERRGKVNVLNETVPQAAHEIVVLSDANTMFERDALKKLVRRFKDPKVGCVCGRLVFRNAEGSKTGELEGVYWKFETMLKKIEGRRGSLLGANGGIYALRKELFQCPPNTIVEDFVIPMKILQKGFLVFYEPEAVAVEETAKHVIQEKQRRIRIGAGDFQALFMLLPMLNPRRGFAALAFWSHKVIRWLVPFFMILIFVLNIFLLNDIRCWFIFFLQYIFYCSALFGQALSRAGKQIKFFNLCYYFVSMNLALLLGFWKFLSRTQKAAWERTER